MEFEIGYEYLFEYLDIDIDLNLNISGAVSTVKTRVVAFIPKDFEDWEIEDGVILRLPIDFKDVPLKESARGDHNCEWLMNGRYLRYYGNIKTIGKYKWTLLKKRKTDLLIRDCPDIVESDLNSEKDYRERNWFLYKNCGLSNESGINYKNITWLESRSYEFQVFFIDQCFYYFIIVKLIQVNIIKDRQISYARWQELVEENYNLNPYYKVKENDWEIFHMNFLKDFLNGKNLKLPKPY